MSVVDELAEKRRKNRENQQRFRDRKKAVGLEPGFQQACWVCGDVFRTMKRGIKVCGEGGCKKEQARTRLKPYTVAHFKKWAKGVILDTGKYWKVEDFQALFLEDVFAGIPEIWLLIAEGNTKTTLLGGLGLYECQFKRYGRVPVAASSRDQAFEMYLQAQGMVDRSEALQPIFVCHEGLRQIKCPSMESRIQIHAADDRTGDGAIFTKALVDEGHRHRDLRLYRTWSGKLQKRPGAQIIMISTAGEPGEEFEQTRDKIRQSLTDRVTSPGFIRGRAGRVALQEYALPEKADPNDLAMVKLANPASFVTLASLKEKKETPTMTDSHWGRFTCNVATRGGNPAITETEWWAAFIDEIIPEGVPIWAGLDIAWKWDTTALVPLWARDKHFFLAGECHILEPPRDGTSLDPDKIEDALLETHARNPIHTLVMDTNRAEQLASWAEKELGCEVVDRGQSNAFQALDYERVTEGLRGGRTEEGDKIPHYLYHNGDVGLTKHVMNARVATLEGNKQRFVRPKGSRQQKDGTVQDRRVIDALSALGMVLTSAWAELQEEYGGVIYA